MSTALGGSADSGNSATGQGTAGNSGSGEGGAAGGTTGGSASGGQASWRDTLPADIKDSPALKSFTDVGNLAKSYIHAQQQIGKKGAIVPGEKASDQEWADFYKAIGVPESDKYEVTPPKDRQVNPETVKAFKEIAVKQGILPKQANQLLDWYTKYEAEALETRSKGITEEANKQMEGLKKEWGDAYDKEIKSAQFAVKELGGDDFVKYLNETGMGNDVHLIRFAAKAAKLMGEDKLQEGGVTEGGQSMSEIQNALAELRAQGDQNGLYNKNHPAHATTLAKMESLAKKLTGGR